MPCRLCSSETAFQFRKTILQKYDIAYYECAGCGSLQTEVPYWLDEAWVVDSVRAPLSLVPRLAATTPLGWILLLRLVPHGGLGRQRLVPLIRRYAASDDVERESRLEAASDDELRELSEAPNGLWDAINRYLDENITSALPYEATVLDSFAQAALEAELELRRRGSA